MALVTSMLILVSLTVIGSMAMTNTIIDTQIAGNSFSNNQRFYASEGAADLALANLPGLLSGTLAEPNGTPINKLDQLLYYDSDDDGIGVGDITPLLKTYLNEEDINTFCNPIYDSASQTGLYTYSVRVEDDNSASDEDNNPLADKNGTVILIVTQTDSIKGTIEDKVSYTVKRVPIRYDGAVNLIDDDIMISMFTGAGITGIDPAGRTIDGVVTTDNVDNFSSIRDMVEPGGVIQNPDHLVHPGIDALHELRDSLANQADADGILEGDEIRITDDNIFITNDDGSSDIIDADNFLEAEIKYVKGKLTLDRNLHLDGVLVLEEHRSSGTFHAGLDIGRDGGFDGLLILLTKSTDFEMQDVEINLGRGAEINGVLLASTQSDPENPHSAIGNKIILDLGRNAHINYREDEVNTPELKQKEFNVLNKDYSPH